MAKRKRKQWKERSPAQKRAFARFQGKGYLTRFNSVCTSMLDQKDLILSRLEKESIKEIKTRLVRTLDSWDMVTDRELNKAREENKE